MLDEAKEVAGDDLVDGAIWVWQHCPRERRAAATGAGDQRERGGAVGAKWKWVRPLQVTGKSRRTA